MDTLHHVTLNWNSWWIRLDLRTNEYNFKYEDIWCACLQLYAAGLTSFDTRGGIKNKGEGYVESFSHLSSLGMLWTKRYVKEIQDATNDFGDGENAEMIVKKMFRFRKSFWNNLKFSYQYVGATSSIIRGAFDDERQRMLKFEGMEKHGILWDYVILSIFIFQLVLCYFNIISAYLCFFWRIARDSIFRMITENPQENIKLTWKARMPPLTIFVIPPIASAAVQKAIILTLSPFCQFP